ncbi:hypothetical protein E8E14_006246 [Neopestalotiopsis sp. 37M]|nr:hypothetical protein E8E14_006246 [Neopestalotiopsis sp. 37M]
MIQSTEPTTEVYLVVDEPGQSFSSSSAAAPPLEPAGWGSGPSPPDPEAFAKAKQHRIEAEARGEDPYAEYKKKVAATEPSSSGIERIYRWAEKKIHKKE